MSLFADLPTQISLDRQIRCVERELGKRRRAFPRWVSEGRMKQTEADEEIAAMDAVRATLCALKEQQR